MSVYNVSCAHNMERFYCPLNGTVYVISRDYKNGKVFEKNSR